MGDSEHAVFTTRMHIIVIGRTLLWTGFVALVIIAAAVYAAITVPFGGFLAVLVLIPAAQFVGSVLQSGRAALLVILFKPPARSLVAIRFKENLQRRGREDDRSDIPPFHNHSAPSREGALNGDEFLPDFR